MIKKQSTKVALFKRQKITASAKNNSKAKSSLKNPNVQTPKNLKGLWSDLGIQLSESDFKKAKQDVWSRFSQIKPSLFSKVSNHS